MLEQKLLFQMTNTLLYVEPVLGASDQEKSNYHLVMNRKNSRSAVLASTIAANVSKIEEFLASNDLPALSLDADAPLQQPGSKEFTRARDATLEAISELEALVLGPLGVLHKASAAVRLF
jgi:hypothetical protein